MSPLSYFAHPHAPNLGLLGHVSPVVVVHLGFAVAAFAIGLIQLLGPKGTLPHRILGWTWVAMMMTVAVSSFFIHAINPKGFSLIHILSVVTLCLLPLGVYAARRHHVNLHRRVMTNTFIGALVIAGIFTFFPGRLVWQMFFG
jgi:uncharacterized membrane protein